MSNTAFSLDPLKLVTAIRSDFSSNGSCGSEACGTGLSHYYKSIFKVATDFKVETGTVGQFDAARSTSSLAAILRPRNSVAGEQSCLACTQSSVSGIISIYLNRSSFFAFLTRFFACAVLAFGLNARSLSTISFSVFGGLFISQLTFCKSGGDSIGR